MIYCLPGSYFFLCKNTANETIFEFISLVSISGMFVFQLLCQLFKLKR